MREAVVRQYAGWPRARQAPSPVPRIARSRRSDRAAQVLKFLLVILTALNLGRLNGMFPALENFPIGKVFLPLCWLALLARSDSRQLFRALRVTQVRMFALLLCAMLLSVVFSLYRGGSFEAFKTFMQGTVPFVFLITVACGDESFLYSIARTMAVTGAILGAALFTPLAKSVEGRLYLGVTYDPNDIALVGVVILPIAVWLIQENGFRSRCLGVLGAAGALAIIIGSASRGGMLGLAAVLALVAIRNRRRMPLRWKTIALVFFCVGLALAPATFWKRLQTLQDPDEDYNTSSLTGREAIWKRGLHYFAARPLTGVGFEEFSFAEGTLAQRYIPPGARIRWSHAHSVWIEVLAETGIFGMIGFLGVYLPTLREVRRMRRLRFGTRSPPESARLIAFGDALAIAIIGFFVAGTFLTMAFSPPAMLLAALGMAYTHVARQHRSLLATGTQRATRPGGPVARWPVQRELQPDRPFDGSWLRRAPGIGGAADQI